MGNIFDYNQSNRELKSKYNKKRSKKLLEDPDTMDMPIINREKQTTDEMKYDRGDFENSYSAKMKATPHPSQMRMENMISAARKAYADKNMAPARKKSTGEEKEQSLNDKQQYTSSGLPDFLYKEDGTKIDSRMIDEGNLSAIHRVHKSGPYVTPAEGGTTGDGKTEYSKGEKFFLKNPIAASKYKMPPAQNKGRKHSRAKAVINTPKKPR